MLKYDCKYFKGDRPCHFNKQNSTVCDHCESYSPIKNKMLIIKLDAIGDVLRTTSILKPLREKYDDYFITWLTKENAKDLFNQNPYVDDVLILNTENQYRLLIEEFEIVINLDNSKVSSAIASAVKGKNKIGFLLHHNGYVIPTNDSADYWLHLSAFDNLKRENKKTYQEIMYSILDLKKPVERPVLIIDHNQHEGNNKVLESKSNTAKTLIGLNIGIGPKWPSKGWPLNKWEELILRLHDNNFDIMLLVGPDEIKSNEYLVNKYSFLQTSGCHNNLNDFASILNRCDIVITSDSLALHIATALNKKLIVLFGPTSANEIELYNSGIKIKAEDECKCFYNKFCSENISCMDKISVDMVFESINKLINN
jgi:heptosyltransferase-2